MKVTAILIFLLVISVNQVFSCTCGPIASVKEEFAKKDFIASGIILAEDVITVIDSVAISKFLQDGKKLDEQMQKRMFGKNFIRFQLVVTEIFKGQIEKDTIDIFTPGTSCKFNFEIGKHYIIYGYENETNRIPKEAIKADVYPKGMNLIWTQYCTRTKLFKKQETNQLKRLKKRKVHNRYYHP